MKSDGRKHPNRKHLRGKGKGALALQKLMQIETDDCVLWPLSTRIGGGYGHVTRTGDDGVRRRFAVHALVCEERHGPRPSVTHEAAHSCGHRSCLNYRHVRWATPTENQADRRIHGTTYEGESQHLAKLDADKVREIRRRYTQGEKCRAIARDYGVTEMTVSFCARKVTWKHVE